jgi:hypothetical protein
VIIEIQLAGLALAIRVTQPEQQQVEDAMARPEQEFVLIEGAHVETGIPITFYLNRKQVIFLCMREDHAAPRIMKAFAQ